MTPIILIVLAAVLTPGPNSAQRSAVCTAELRAFVRPPERLQSESQSVAGDAVIQLGVSTAVSRPAGECLPASVEVRATYFGADSKFICSGNARAAVQNEHTGVTMLQIRPWRTKEFVLWENGPPKTLPTQLLCRDSTGAVIVEPWEADSLRLQITVLPANGGVASAEFEIKLDVP